MPVATAPKPQDIAFEAIEGTHKSNLLLLYDHASNSLPDGWDGLGLSPERLEQHIAWDIAAAAEVLRGRRVAAGVELYVAAASSEVDS